MIIKIDVKKTDGEYCVRWIQDGKRIESKCYYTDDKEDAEGTLRHMQGEAAVYLMKHSPCKAQGGD